VKRFADLTEQEILALSITNEEEDSRIYRSFAEGLRGKYAASAKMFDEMADEEVQHRTMLFDLYRKKFGEFLPLIRRQDVKGFVRHKPIWLTQQLGIDEVRKYAANMEYETARFYRKAAETGDRGGEARTLDNLGVIHARQGRYPQAAEHHQHARAFFSEKTSEPYCAWAPATQRRIPTVMAVIVRRMAVR